MRLSQYPKTETLAANSYLITDHPSKGTKAVIPKDLMKNLLSFTDRDMFFDFLDEIADLPMRKKIFRGKNLGASISEEQNDAIKDGSFKGMFVGDYWEIGEDQFVIYDMDYYVSSNVPHHLILCENKLIGPYVMSDLTSGSVGFANSYVYQTVLADYDSKLNGIFSTHCFSVPYQISSEISADNVVIANVNNTKCSGIMSEVEIYGTVAFSNMSKYGPALNSPFGRFSYFSLKGYWDLFGTGFRFWLRNNSSFRNGYYCFFCANDLIPNAVHQTSDVIYVLPFFTIKGV